jgi:predicted DNA-binding ribbon-helix-helix protein
MAPRRTDNGNHIALAPDAPVGAAYERDFYSWLMEQARRVREGRWDAVDRENLAEEIESLGREQFNKLESALRVLLLHILKWDHQPKLRSRSWVLSIKAQRTEVEDVLSDNPGLKPRIPEAIVRGYRRARIEAAKETELEESAFPETCRYSFDEIMSREFSL